MYRGIGDKVRHKVISVLSRLICFPAPHRSFTTATNLLQSCFSWCPIVRTGSCAGAVGSKLSGIPSPRFCVTLFRTHSRLISNVLYSMEKKAETTSCQCRAPMSDPTRKTTDEVYQDITASVFPLEEAAVDEIQETKTGPMSEQWPATPRRT